MCRKPTDPSNPIHWVGSGFRAWWVGLGYKIFFYSRSGWVWVIKLQTRQTRPDPPIFKIYYIFNNFFLKQLWGTSLLHPAGIYRGAMAHGSSPNYSEVIVHMFCFSFFFFILFSCFVFLFLSPVAS